MLDTIQISSCSLTHPGKKKPNNEDYVSFYEPGEDDPSGMRAAGSLYVVADGVGGATEGERASWYAAEKVKFLYYSYDPQMGPADMLQRAILQANHEIYEYSALANPPRRTATTIVAAVIRGNQLTVANVGDSRAYLIRDGAIHQLTEDHSAVGEMVRHGLMTQQEAEESPIKNRLMRAMGSDDDVHAYVHPTFQLFPGDQLLLCSDGLTRHVKDAELVSMVVSGDADLVVKQMVDLANQRGGLDNITVLLASVLAGVATGKRYATGIGAPPTRIDFDLMETGPLPGRRTSAVNIPPQWRQQRTLRNICWQDLPPRTRKVGLLTSAGVIAIILGIIAAVNLFPGKPDPVGELVAAAFTASVTSSAQSTLALPLTPTPNTLETQIVFWLMGTQTQIAIAATQRGSLDLPATATPIGTSAVILTPANTATSTSSVTPGMTQTNTLSPTLTPDPLKICIRQVKIDDVLLNIYPGYVIGSTYSYFLTEDCKIGALNICQNLKYGTDPKLIQPGWWIVVGNDLCTDSIPATWVKP